MWKSIGLQLPERNKPGKDSFNTRPRAVEEWIESLPKASVGRCAQLLYAALKDTNGLDVKFKHRVRMLEAFREPVQYVAQSMQKHFIGSAVPLTGKNHKIAYATRELYLLMALGYKIAIEDTLSDSLFMDKKNLTTLIHRAITYISRMMLTTYQVYESLPESTWSNLHKLYAHAEMLGVEKTTITDNQHQYISKTTIEGEYARILLLSLTSPYQLHHGDVGNVYVNLERWMRMAHLHKIKGDTLPDGDFVVALDEDNPPCYLALAGDEIYGGNIRVLDTCAITETLYGELQKSEQLFSKILVRVNMEKANLSHNLLRRLSTSWGAIPKRVHKRKEFDADVTIAIGLSATHQAILNYANTHSDFSQSVAAEDSQIMRVIETQSKYQAKTLAHTTDNQPDVWEMVFDHGKLELVNAKAIESVLDNMPDNVYCTMDDWKLLNQSASGFSVQCQSECGHCLQVGEIIGLTPSSSNSPKHWTVGVVRWIKMDDKKGVAVGGQLLGRAAIPVGVTMAADTDDKDRVQRALLLPAVKQLARSSTLITHPGNFREGAILHVYLPAGTIEIKLTREYDSKDLYCEFEYQLVTQLSMGEGAGSSNSRTNDPADDFEDVWSSI